MSFNPDEDVKILFIREQNVIPSHSDHMYHYKDNTEIVSTGHCNDNSCTCSFSCFLFIGLAKYTHLPPWTVMENS